MSMYPDLNNPWYSSQSPEMPELVEQISAKLILIRKNVVKTIDDEGHDLYVYDERVIGFDDWNMYIDTLTNTTDIAQTNVGLMDNYEATMENTDAIEENTQEIVDVNNALIELYEMIIGE